MSAKTDPPMEWTFRVHWSDEDEAWLCRCVEWPGVATHGDTPEDALREMGVAFAGVLEAMRADRLGDKHE